MKKTAKATITTRNNFYRRETAYPPHGGGTLTIKINGKKCV